MKKNYLIALLFILLFPLGLLAQDKPEVTLQKAKSTLPKQCFFYFEMFLHAKAPKAFAYAIDSQEKVTCRFSSTSKNQARANEVALLSCQKNALEKGIKHPCKLYKMRHTLAKTNKQLNFEEKYLLNYKTINKHYTKQVKKTKKNVKIVLPKPCIMFYNLYQEAKPYKAFALAVDSEKKYTCKYSAGSVSMKKAQEVALRSCEKTRVKRKIKAACSLFEQGIKIAKKEKPKKEKPKKEKPKKEKPKKEIKKKEIKKKEAEKKELPKKKTLLKKSHKPHSALSFALQKAILAANLTKIKALIKQGADINTQAPDKSRALFVAVAQNDLAYAKALLKKGAFVFIKKRDGNNLLVAAIMSGNNTMLRLMLEQKIDPNIRCEDGNTPLHFAFMMFDDKMMKTLYTFGARDDIKNAKGKTVQDLAKEFHINLKRIRR